MFDHVCVYLTLFCLYYKSYYRYEESKIKIEKGQSSSGPYFYSTSDRSFSSLATLVASLILPLALLLAFFNPYCLNIHFFKVSVSLNRSNIFLQFKTTMKNVLPHSLVTQLDRHGPAAVVTPVLIPKYSLGFA